MSHICFWKAAELELLSIVLARAGDQLSALMSKNATACLLLCRQLCSCAWPITELIAVCVCPVSVTYQPQKGSLILSGLASGCISCTFSWFSVSVCLHFSLFVCASVSLFFFCLFFSPFVLYWFCGRELDLLVDITHWSGVHRDRASCEVW